MFLFFSYQIKTPVEAVVPLPPYSQLPAPQTPKSQARESPPAGAGLPGALSRLPRSPLGTDAPDAQGLGAARGTGGFRASAGGEGRAGIPGAGAEGATVRGVEARVEPGWRWRRTQGEGRRGASLGDPGWNWGRQEGLRGEESGCPVARL